MPSDCIRQERNINSDAFTRLESQETITYILNSNEMQILDVQQGRAAETLHFL